MDLMLDNNIIIDHVCKREPFYELSRKVCLLGIAGYAKVYVSTNMLTDIYYILRKIHGSKKAQRLIEEGLSFIEWIGVTPSDIRAALNARWNDLEDCLVARCAAKINADFIITRNVKDFKASPIEAITLEDLFDRLAEKGELYEEIEW